MPKYEYHLKFWGQIENDNLAERCLGTSETNFWFESAEEREAFKEKIKNVAKENNVCVVFDENEGFETRKKTIAKMDFVFPDGRAFHHEMDFGFAYPVGSAEFMLLEGNYSCDCNRSLFVSENNPEVELMGCGDLIELRNLVILQD